MRHNGVPSFEVRVKQAQLFAWQKLVQVGRQCLHGLLQYPSAPVQWYQHVLAGVRVGIDFAAWMQHILAEAPCAGRIKPATMPLRLGLANPSVTGCMDIKGERLNWQPILDENRGIYPAMTKLGLDAVGLTAARLSPNACLPTRVAGVLVCRGGPQYGSTAVLRSQSFAQCSAVRQDIGNNRRMWTDIVLEDGRSLFWVTLSLPPEGTQRDEEWMTELEGLACDVQLLHASSTKEPLFLCTGDMNIQPDNLGDRPEPSRTRQRAWEAFLDKTSFATFNPFWADPQPQEVHLPFRDRTVTIWPHTTRHHHRGPGRAIDLVFGSSSLAVDVFIHNSISCGGVGTCPVACCQEIGCGDHFLLRLEVALSPASSSSCAAPHFPGKWHDKRRWTTALRQAEAPLRQLTAAALQGYQDHRRAPAISNIGLEACAMLLNTMAGALRDIWIGGSVSPRSDHSSLTNITRHLEIVDSEELEDISRQLSSAPSGAALLHKTCRLLKPHTPQPVCCMIEGHHLLTETETHQKWCQALLEQCGPQSHIDQGFQHLVCNRLQTLLNNARSKHTQLHREMPFLQHEVAEVISGWSASCAMPPDLLPRALFMCNSDDWNDAVWALQKWAGPSGAAHRPSLWRAAALCPLHKKGSAAEISSFRLIFNKAQMGLVQEALFTQRWLLRVRSFVMPCQSGYVRGADDAWLLLHETCAEALSQHRPIWLVLGDFRKAFPSVIREDLLHSLADGPGVSGDSLLLCASILKQDSVLVWHSGLSEVTVSSGIPEGGTLGPLAYPCLLDSLVRELLAKECGVGLEVTVPPAWSHMCWKGQGSPSPHLVQDLKASIQLGHQLPSTEALQADATLEASALRAINDLAPHRLVAVLHADDPVILGCCRGETQRSLNILSDWARRHGASFHVGESKTVSMICCSSPCVSPTACGPSLLLDNLPLAFKNQHRWLGITWSASLSFQDTLSQKAALAGAIWSSICGLLHGHAFPLDLALSLFRSKVLPVLLFGACLYGLEANLEEFLSRLQSSWARQVLKLEPWRNAAVAAAERGWTLPLHLEVVLEIAMKRFRLWQLPDGDLYKTRFMWSHGVGQSWACKSLNLIESWGLVDWMEWKSPHCDYRAYARQHLEMAWFGSWLKEAELSQQPPAYTSFQAVHSRIPETVAAQMLPWDTRMGILSLCRLRAGSLRLSSLNGRPSAAKIQRCICCSRRTRAARVHVMAVCDHWLSQRQQVCQSLGLAADELTPADLCRSIIGCSPTATGFRAVVSWAVKLDRHHSQYWGAQRLGN